MAHSFHRIAASIRNDNGLWSTSGILCVLLLLAGWSVWAFTTKVTRYEVADSARLEVNSKASPIEPASSGRIVASTMVLGREVRQGEMLAELDSTAEQSSLAEERARYTSIQPQLALLSAQMESVLAGEAADRSVSHYSNVAADGQYRQADVEASLAEQQAVRAHQMRVEGILAPADADRMAAEAQSKRAMAESLKASMARVEPELRVKERDRELRIKEIAATRAKLQSDLSVSAATIKRLEEAIERRKVRAPIAGRLAECAPLPPGAHVAEGQQLGIILPSSQVRIVAQFQPAAALGKIHPGQRAVMRLDGFPWAQYGVVTAEVTGLADEVRDGKVRVELAVTQAPRIRLQHGLPGLLEIATERTTPAGMLLQSAGTLAGAH